MTKPSNERRELHRSTHELRATELDAVNGGSWFKYLSDILKGQSDTLKSIAQNLRYNNLRKDVAAVRSTGQERATG